MHLMCNSIIITSIYESKVIMIDMKLSTQNDIFSFKYRFKKMLDVNFTISL